MTRFYFIYNTVRYLIDIPLLLIAYGLAVMILHTETTIESDRDSLLFVISSIVSWYIATKVTKLYSDLRSKKFSEEIIYILSSLLLFIILFTSFLFFFRDKFQVTNLFLAFYFSVSLLLILIFKYALRKYLHSVIYKGKLNERILLIGSTPSAKYFYDTINEHYFYGYTCLGFLDDKQTKLNGATYLGKVSNLAQVLAENEVDEVVIALPNSQHEHITASIDTCDYYAKRTRIIPDLQFYAASNLQINNIGLLPVINLRSLPQDRWENKILKRSFDVCFSTLFFILLGWWLLPLIALLIKFTSKGPVFFSQERWGLNNKKIICYKFRTMYHGAPTIDANGNFVQTSKNDTRVTPLGRYLRKYNLDEYPQFWNVLLGDMSVVGPRPHVTPMNLDSIQKIDRYMLRHLVRPGITGWAQVNGCRGETATPAAMQQRVNFDLYYIHKWTFWLDCQIILQTIINTIRGDKDAY